MKLISSSTPGSSINAETAGVLSEEIEQIRIKNGYKPEDLLKFNTHQRPDHIGIDAHRNAESELLDDAAKFGVVMFASFILHILHDIAELAWFIAIVFRINQHIHQTLT